MCKRTVSLLLCGVMLCACFSSVACADSTATDRRGAFEFVELYMNRLTTICENNNIGADIWISGNTKWPGSGQDGIASVDTEIGLVDVDLSDFSLKQVEITIYDDADTEEESLYRTFQYIAAISALEYSYDDAKRLRMSSQVLNGPKDEIEAATEISVEILKRIKEETGSSGLPDGEISVYSGNYEYSVYAMVYDIRGVAHKSLNLIAEAR